MKSGYQTSKLEKLLHRTTAGLFVLSALCFMIYTTELHYAHAEGDEDLGSASSSLDASVTVGTACNFSSNVDNQHNATITNGVNSTDIGKTTLNVTCNDQGGYAVYAIGYTNDEYGNTSLKSSISDDYNIPTGTSTSGNTSNWSMKLSTVPGTTTATIENGYNNYHTVPDDYTKVATLNTITNPGSSTTGSSISTTYQAYISPTQPAGTYTGKVKYTLVHPSTAPVPETPPTYMQDTATIKSKLTNVGDTMQAVDSRDNKKYWITKLADGNIWMTQNLDLCIGCEDTQSLTSLNTDLNASDGGAYSEGYANDNGIITWSPNSTAVTSGRTISETSVSGWSHGYYEPYSAEGGDTYVYTSFNNDNDTVYSSLDECASDHSYDECNHYHIGNYYNWNAAIASNSSSSISTKDEIAANSICPAGWRLPNDIFPQYPSLIVLEFGWLFQKSNIITGYNSYAYTENGFDNLRTSPLYFVRGGYIWGDTLKERSSKGNYWSSIGDTGYYAIESYFTNDRAYSNSNSWMARVAGSSVRCLIK